MTYSSLRLLKLVKPELMEILYLSERQRISVDLTVLKNLLA
jgi:hypothetical protein